MKKHDLIQIIQFYTLLRARKSSALFGFPSYKNEGQGRVDPPFISRRFFLLSILTKPIFNKISHRTGIVNVSNFGHPECQIVKYCNISYNSFKCPNRQTDIIFVWWCAWYLGQYSWRKFMRSQLWPICVAVQCPYKVPSYKTIFERNFKTYYLL